MYLCVRVGVSACGCECVWVFERAYRNLDN